MSTDTEIRNAVHSPPVESASTSQPEGDERDSPIGDPSALSKGLLRPRTILSFAFALAILVYFIRRMDLNLAAVVDNIRAANLLLLAAAIAVYVTTIVLRAARSAASCSTR